MKNKTVTILLVIILTLLLLGLTILTWWFIFSKANNIKNSVKVKWGNIYYDYLKDIKELGSSEVAGLPEDMKKGTISFYEVDGIEYPVMNIRYESNNKSYSNIYYIDEKHNKVDVIVFEDTTIDMLYDKKNNSYEYYTHSKKNNIDLYKSLKDQINEKLNKKVDVKEYIFENEILKGTKEKFNELFAKIESEVQEYDYDINIDLNKLKNVVNEYSKKIKDYTKNITDKIKKMVEDKEFDVKDIEKTVDKIENMVENKTDEIINSVDDLKE